MNKKYLVGLAFHCLFGMLTCSLFGAPVIARSNSEVESNISDGRQLKIEKKIGAAAIKQILDYQPTTIWGDLAREIVSFLPFNFGLLSFNSTWSQLCTQASTEALSKGIDVNAYTFKCELGEQTRKRCLEGFGSFIAETVVLQLLLRVLFDKFVRKTDTIDNALDVLLRQNSEKLKMSHIDLDKIEEKILEVGDKNHVLRWIGRALYGLMGTTIIFSGIKGGAREKFKKAAIPASLLYLIVYFVVVGKQSVSAKTKVRLEKLRQLRAMLKENNDSSLVEEGCESIA